MKNTCKEKETLNWEIEWVGGNFMGLLKKLKNFSMVNLQNN